MENENCVTCGKGTYRAEIGKDYKYLTPMGFVTIEGNSKFLKCDKCGQTLIPGETYDIWNKLILKRLTEKHGLLDPKELQFVLSVLPQDQKEIADAMGKDKSTLTHYKNGKNPIDPLFDYTLRDIVLDFLEGSTETLNRLKQAFKFAGEPTLKKVHAH